MNNFEKEWAIIHGDIEKYEKISLIIKLASVFASLLCVAYTINEWLSITFILVLWMQDAIWKTFQKRMETRIIFIEQELKTKPDKDSNAFQLYSQWGEQRQGVSGLIKEYILSAAKPTVAYPYALLIILIVVFYQYG